MSEIIKEAFDNIDPEATKRVDSYCKGRTVEKYTFQRTLIEVINRCSVKFEHKDANQELKDWQNMHSLQHQKDYIKMYRLVIPQML